MNYEIKFCKMLFFYSFDQKKPFSEIDIKDPSHATVSVCVSFCLSVAQNLFKHQTLDF